MYKNQGVQRRQFLCVFLYFKLLFCFVVAIRDLLHDADTIHGPC